MSEADRKPLNLFADGLALVYHEARNVRHLFQKSDIPSAEWARLVSSLPKNRIDAWKQLQTVRQAARSSATAHDAARLFASRLGKSLNDLEVLYQDPNWKHAKAWGGHAWRDVTAIVANLGQAIDQCNLGRITAACAELLQAHHNNGPIRQKIVELDSAVGVTTDVWWL